MRITDLRALRLTLHRDRRAFAPEQRRVWPLDIYPEVPHPARDNTGPGPERQYFLEIEASDGVVGTYGPVPRLTAFIALSELRPFLLGRDPRPIEALWDQMARLDHLGRTGEAMAAIGAVDCALWDMHGHRLGLPVHALLGGPTREGVAAYASLMDMSHEPESLAARAQAWRDRGFAAQKWMIAHGPGSGEAGRRANVALLRGLRAALGDEYRLMLDAWTGWELDYAVEMTRALEPFGLAWIEEPLAANRVEAHRALKAATRIPIATGEHVFTRWGIKPFLDAGAVDIVQFDICWTGGLTESVKVCALAAAHDRPTVPHGGNLAATLHLLFAQPPWLCPWISYVPKLVERSQAALHPLPEPVGGVLAPPPGPGLGIRFDPDRIAHRAAVRWDG